MKKRLMILLLSAALVLMFTGCAKTESVATKTSSTASDWRTVTTASITHEANYIGFLDETHGITVGLVGTVKTTSDGGKAWSDAANNSACLDGLDIVDENIAWACGNKNGVVVTKDGGKTWSGVTPFGDNEPNQCRYLSFIDGTTGYIASITRLATTTDGGKTWTELKVPQGLKEIAAISFDSATSGYLLDSLGGLYYTIDSGKTFTKTNIDLSSLKLDSGISTLATPHAALRFTDANNGVIALSGISNKKGKTFVGKTTDGGKTFTFEPLDLGANYLLTGIYLSHNGDYLTVSNLKDITVLKRIK